MRVRFIRKGDIIKNGLFWTASDHRSAGQRALLPTCLAQLFYWLCQKHIIRDRLIHQRNTFNKHIVCPGLFAIPGAPDYCSSKHAAVGLHQSLYLDLQKDGCTGIKTTLVCPYLVHTGMFRWVSCLQGAIKQVSLYCFSKLDRNRKIYNWLLSSI